MDTFSPYIGNPNILSITTLEIQEYIHLRLKKNNIAVATASIELRILKTIFNQAINWQYLEINPVKGVKLPLRKTIKVRFLLIDEVNRFLDVITDSSWLNLATLYLTTGARRAELLPPLFTWQNVNFEKRLIHFFGKANITRFVPMNDTTFTILSSLKNEGRETPFNWKPDTVTHKIKAYFRAAGIEDANVKSLRKTFGSLQVQCDPTSYSKVSKMLGHTTLKTTQKYYVDFLQEDYYQSVKNLDDLIPALPKQKKNV